MENLDHQSEPWTTSSVLTVTRACQEDKLGRNMSICWFIGDKTKQKRLPLNCLYLIIPECSDTEYFRVDIQTILEYRPHGPGQHFTEWNRWIFLCFWRFSPWVETKSVFKGSSSSWNLLCCSNKMTEVCVYCGDNLGTVVDIKSKRHYQEHVKVHKVLRHKKIPFKVYGQIYSAVNGCRKTLLLLDKL